MDEKHDSGASAMYARALEQMTEVLLTETDKPRVLEALTRITGETLHADRSQIYEVRLDEQLALAHSEWLNPAANIGPTQTSYPLSVFAGGDAEMRRTRSFIESQSEEPHPAFVADGSAQVLHGQLSIRSLLWFPFDFRDSGYYLLVFNQVTHRREWLPAEREFLRIATRHATLAVVQLAIESARAESQRAQLEAQKAESISVLAGGVAHDFNTLLGIVLGVVGRTRAVLGDAHPLAPDLRDAERASREAADLAKHLLAYAGGGQFIVETLDLASLADEMQDLLRAAAGRVRVQFTSAGPCPLRGDAGQLRQVLMNFVLNAAEAIGDAATGEIAMSVRLDSSDARAPRVVLEVRDNGRGMAPEVQRRILEPFFTTKTLGRGLGLAAVSGIVRSHGGDLQVHSKVGEGTTFTVRFPAATMEKAADPEPARPSSARAAAGAKLLLVDDNDNFRRMCAKLLDDFGYQTLDTASGADAIERVRAHGDEIDAVALDWTMPAPGGAETFRRLRELRADLPIVIMSGYAEGPATELSRERRTAFVEKPFTAEALDAALRSVLA